MNFSLTNGTARQTGLFNAALGICSYPLDGWKDKTVVVTWVPTVSNPDHSAFADSWVDGDTGHIEIRDDLDKPNRDVEWTGDNFYMETVLHEMGHIVAGFKGVTSAQMTSLFAGNENGGYPGPGGTDDDWDTGAWQNRIQEAVAETFKDLWMAKSKRVYDNRTNWILSFSALRDFVELMWPPQPSTPEGTLPDPYDIGTRFWWDTYPTEDGLFWQGMKPSQAVMDHDSIPPVLGMQLISGGVDDNLVVFTTGDGIIHTVADPIPDAVPPNPGGWIPYDHIMSGGMDMPGRYYKTWMEWSDYKPFVIFNTARPVALTLADNHDIGRATGNILKVWDAGSSGLGNINGRVKFPSWDDVCDYFGRPEEKDVLASGSNWGPRMRLYFIGLPVRIFPDGTHTGGINMTREEIYAGWHDTPWYFGWDIPPIPEDHSDIVLPPWPYSDTEVSASAVPAAAGRVRRYRP